MFDKLTSVESRYDELTAKLGSPEVQADAAEYTRAAKALAEIEELVTAYRDYRAVEQDIAGAEELVATGDDEMTALATEELATLTARRDGLLQQLKILLVPRDPNDERSVLLEIRGGTGGDEASLFAADLFRMYSRHAERNSWKLEVLSSSESSSGGLKEVIASIEGKGVYSKLKYESGVHRVQRVPATETQGRIHTSTVTVAVMPEAQEVDIELKPDELHIQATRSGGPGGQHVNTTDSAVQITHLPTGIQVKCQDGRSQGQNKEKALEILRSKLFEVKQHEEQEKYSAQRRALIGSGDRSEKIRTYNFPQSRVTDHRINYTSHNIDGILTGAVQEFTEELQKAEMAQRLAESGIEA
jgi:peptide chain release factor 1